jgi:hypothetical protein
MTTKTKTKTLISDLELLKALGYGEDSTLKYNNAIEATVRHFKKHWARQSANY